MVHVAFISIGNFHCNGSITCGNLADTSPEADTVATLSSDGVSLKPNPWHFPAFPSQHHLSTYFNHDIFLFQTNWSYLNNISFVQKSCGHKKQNKNAGYQ